jgi:NitT/TauT family transport system substrate-binding protein
MPLWAAIKQGWPEGCGLDVDYWKNLDDLRGLMLAGTGDIWLGNLEGFARAAARGAPVTVAAVTGWKKFFVVAAVADEASGWTPPADLDGLARVLRQTGRPLAVAPPNSPAQGLLEEMARRGGPAFDLEPLPAQQLMLELGRGSRPAGLLPEPLVSVLLAKNPRLRILAGVEEDFARRFGGPDRRPMVGLAVNRRLAQERPELVRGLVRALEAGAAALDGQPPEAAVAVLPPAVIEAVGREPLVASLSRDPILARPAAGAASEIEAFLRLTAPELYAGKEPGWRPSPDFLFDETPPVKP